MGDADPREVPAARLTEAMKTELLPRLAEEGAFGEGWRLEGVRVEPIAGLGKDHWASTTLTTAVDLRRGSETRSEALVAKWMLPSDGFEGFMLTDLQASNEIKMYTEVFPFMERLAEGSGVPVGDLHPKHYLAALSPVKDTMSLTLMEDLRAKGFRLTKERTALDRQHANLVLRSLGRLHALSHAAKARCRGEFLEEVTPLLREVAFLPEWSDRWSFTLGSCFRRGLDRLSSRLRGARPPQDGQDAGQHRRRLDGLRRLEDIADDVYSIMLGAAARTEPAGVLVHGDFNRNNMQFRYNELGEPVEVRFFDFQNCRYCSPSVDLSFFLFMNTSPELRRQHWDDLLQEYFGSMTSALDRLLEGHEVHEDFVRPTLQGVRDDLKQHALWGYVICSFFLPQMAGAPEDVPDMEEMKDKAISDPATVVAIMCAIGGEEATEGLADMLLEYIDRDLVP